MENNKKYRHPIKTKRPEPAALKNRRYSLGETARVLERSPETISGEVKKIIPGIIMILKGHAAKPVRKGLTLAIASVML